MLSYGENASVLLLSGNISYERVVEKISSLEPILAQENDYLRNQGGCSFGLMLYIIRK
jgi:hypothetical protein